MRSHDSIGEFWIVFLTEHKVFDILSVLVDTQSAVCHCPVADQSYPLFGLSYQSVDTFTF